MQKSTTKKCFMLLLIMGMMIPKSSLGQQTNDTRILLQGFYWEAHDAKPEGWYNHVSGRAQELSAAGINMIWLPPPSDAGSDEGYLPRQLSNLTNGYGTASDHMAMLQNLNNNGIEPIADIVINHRVGSTNWVDFTNPTWGTWSITSNDEVWNQSAYQGLERGNNDTGSEYDAARDLDHTNQGVRDGIKNWLNELKTAGYKGWRYDLVHGFSASYINEYNTASGASFSVGEDWNDKQHIQDWIDGTGTTSTGFDFPTYYALKAAIKDNNYSYLAFNDGGTLQASGLIGWSPAQSTTFIENHDTPRYDAGNNVLNGGNIGHAYAYLLTHPGVPTIYWPHYFDWGAKGEINTLIAIRKDNGISSSSSLQIIESSNSVYAALVNGNVAMKIGGGNWSPSQAGWSDAGDYTLQASGNNYAVWAKGGSGNNAPQVSVNPKGPFSSSTSFEVQITASDDSGLTPTIYYTTNGEEPTTSNSMVSLTGSVSYNATTSHTLKVMAIDNEGLASATQTHEYTIVSTSDFSVYWKNPNPNATARIHHWNATPAGSLSNSNWPGNTMQDASSEYGDGWVKYVFSGISSTNLLFHNGSDQTPDLSRGSTGWYDGGWVSEPQPPIDTEAPVLTVSPAGGNYANAVSVTLFGTDNQDNSPTINYTLNGVAFSAEGAITLTISQASTLVATATDDSNNTSASQTHSYTFNPSSNLIIHYKGTLSSPTIYYWGAAPNGGQSTGWPGSTMTAEADGWFVFEIPDADCSNLIFSSNGANQTADLDRCGEGWYQDGTWYDQKPVDGTGFTVHFKPNIYTDPEIYFWGGNASTAWPGETMTSEGGGWYSYHIADDDCSNIIFSNNGGSQTADLYRCGDGWYENGSWSGSNPNAREHKGPFSIALQNEAETLSIRAFPNPSSYFTSFEYFIPEATRVTLILRDVTGREVQKIVELNQEPGKYNFRVDVSGLNRGIYFFEFKAGDKRMTHSIAIE